LISATSGDALCFWRGGWVGDTMEEENLPLHPVVVLSKYFTWASHMRTGFDKSLSANPDLWDRWNDPKALEIFMYMSLWYATLYTVIEGWRRLKLRDDEIGSLLASPFVKMLKTYRHGVTHFQTRYYDKKYMPFVTKPESVAWVRALHGAFFRYLNDWFKTHDLDGSLKGPVNTEPS
jgi:hypothetical protein